MRRLGVVVMVVVMLGTAGCLPIVVGAGTAVVREMTDVAMIYRGNINAVRNGVEKAVKDLGASVVERVAEEGKAGRHTIRARTFDGEHLTIDMEPTSPSSVMVEIRVGRIGSKARAQEFHKAIQKYVKLK